MTTVTKEPNANILERSTPDIGETVVPDEHITEETFHQYVTFYIENEAFAFPMTSVLEIIRVPETVRVPLTPKSLIGLANLRGSVLPILDLRRILDLTESEHDDATRVIVANCGLTVGLIVDRIARVMNVESDNIESAETVQSNVQADLLTGVLKNIEGFNLIQLLDIEKILKLEYESISKAKASENTLSGKSNQIAATSQTEDELDDNTVQLVDFVVEDQEYAFDISQVEEIVRVPDVISKIPHTEPHVLGIINLRNRLLPLVSLRRMFCLSETPIGEQNRILVLRLNQNASRHESVGIVVDQVREVLRVPSSVQENLPELLARSEDTKDVQSVCRLDEGNRLVSMLSARAMFKRPEMQKALEMGKKENEDAAMNKTKLEEETQMEDDTQLVVFKLDDEEFGVLIESVQEIIRIPEEMSRVPKTADFIEGMVNLRGSVLPVLDMRVRFDLDRIERNDGQRILVLNLDGVQTGFIVDSLSEVLRLPQSIIEHSPKLSSEQTRIMGRVANLKDSNRMILVLDAKELLDEEEMISLSKNSQSATN